MKVILSGATGFIGREVLNQALAHPAITSLVCITRKALPETARSNPKLKAIILTDFLSYTPEILSQLEGAESCIWAMGAPASKAATIEDSRNVDIRYMLAAAEAFTNSLAPPLKAQEKTFRFVLLGAMLACRDQKKSLWFLPTTRKMKGEAENGLLALQEKDESNLDVTITRPGGVVPTNTLMPQLMVASTSSIRVDELAAVLIDEAIAGANGTRTLECDVLRNRGRELLKGT